MEYIITEDRLEKLVLRFLEQSDIVDDAQIENGRVIIYLKRPIHLDKIKDLANSIKTMFDYHGDIYKPSRTRWNYVMVYSF
jgi:hypothetical protein